MSLTRILLFILLAFFMYKFVFGFLVPLVKVSLKMRRQMKEFQRQHQQNQFQQNNNAASSQNFQTNNNNGSTTKEKTGDYIDFEEIKD